MKKARVIMVLVSMLSLLFACAQTTERVATPAPAPATPTPSLERILQKGELVVGTAASMPPLNMTTKDGEIIGLEADLAKYAAGAMGVKLRFAAMPFSELIPALEAGKIDMIMSGMTITPRRNLKVAFVGPYFISGKAFLTKIERIASAKEPTEINSPNVTLAALEGSTSQAFVEKILPEAKLVPTKNYDEAVKMVLEDNVDALVADYPICVVSFFRYPDQGLIAVITPFTYEPLGIAVPGDDPHLINWVENFLKTIQGSGALEELKRNWFGAGGSWLKRLP
jgi:polar amino acid transport system substrate-binding protein